MTDIEDFGDVEQAIEKAEAVKERLKSDPAAVRKLLGKNVEIDDFVTVYPDKELNREYKRFRERLLALSENTVRRIDETEPEWNERIAKEGAENKGLQDEFEALEERLKESGVTFRLVSIGKGAIKELRKAARKKFPLPEDGFDDPTVAEERDEFYKASIVAAHLIQDGYTIEDVESIRDNWPTDAFAKLWVSAQTLSIADDFLRGSLSPDFS